MRYVVPIVIFFLLVFPVKFMLGEHYVGLLGFACFALGLYWPKLLGSGERTPDSTS